MMKTILSQAEAQPRASKSGRARCVTCRGAHSHRNCPATDGNIYRDNIQEYVSQAAAANFNQGNTNSRPPMVANQIRPPGFPPIQNNQNTISIRIKGIISTKIKEPISIKTVEITSTKDKFTNLRLVNHRFTKLNLIKLPLRKCKFVNSNTASTLSSGSLLSNTVTNPKEDLKGITTRSGVAYQGPNDSYFFS
ncbi:hypothetical protein Tco_0121970 [Tanacetum coccineum]|uniref:Reverse transcriptase domain-containing protein n=1 Tax=Tanacetum coccineum TaxID=301880 RepID=A0ABQ5B8T2_9ASTR